MWTYQLYSLWERSVFPVLLRKPLYYFSQTFCWACWKTKAQLLKDKIQWPPGRISTIINLRIYPILGNALPQEEELIPQTYLASHTVNTILIFSCSNLRSHDIKWSCELQTAYICMQHTHKHESAHLRTIEDFEKNLKTTNTFIELHLRDAVSSSHLKIILTLIKMSWFSAGLVFYTMAHTMLRFGYRMKAVVITHWCFHCCRAVLTQSFSASRTALPARSWEVPNQDS